MGQIDIGDSVFGVKDSLIKHFEDLPTGPVPLDGRDLGDRPWSRVRFDVILAPARPTGKRAFQHPDFSEDEPPLRSGVAS